MKKQIQIVTNGPFIVRGIEVLYTQGGHEIELPPVAELCRCGQSFDMPFCDGNHIIFEFDDRGNQTECDHERFAYKGKNITVYYKEDVCSHRGICYEELPEVFRMDGKNPILPDEGSIESIIDICERCPSGALSYSLAGDQIDHHAEDGDWNLRLSPRRYGFDGPLEVRGDVELIDPTGALPESEEHYALCRCGHSHNMPFCTGEHWKEKYIDDSNDE